QADNDATKTRNAANAYAQNRLPNAKSQAANEIAQARSYSDRVVATARGDKARFDAVLAEYRKAPKATRERLYSEMMNDVITANRLVLVGGGTGHASVNLDMPASRPAAAASVQPSASAAPSSTAAEQANPKPSPRSRNRKGGAR
ncbi:MAG: hypothetical protein L0H29_08520, partial [Sinobacteraceae bacterium]|nr:hypothetical protein [Nevskiaceae bacterium]